PPGAPAALPEAPDGDQPPVSRGSLLRRDRRDPGAFDRNGEVEAVPRARDAPAPVEGREAGRRRMNCETFRDRAFDFLQGTLREHAEFEAHRGSAPAWAARRTGVRQTDGVVAAARVPTAPAALCLP